MWSAPALTWLRILQLHFFQTQWDIRVVWGKRVIIGHVDPAPDLGNSKVIPMVLSLAQWRSAEQLGNSDSWEPSQSPADPRCSSLPLSLQLFPLSLFSFTISTPRPSVEKTGKAVFQLWNSCFRQLLLSPSPPYPRCSPSCVKMSELCKWYYKVWRAG